MMLGVAEDEITHLTGKSACHMHGDRISVEHVQRLLFPPEFCYVPHQTEVVRASEKPTTGLTKIIASMIIVGAIFGSSVFTQYSFSDQKYFAQVKPSYNAEMFK